jgi:hypothetical protein
VTDNLYHHSPTNDATANLQDTPAGWEDELAPGCFAGVNKTSPNVKTKIIRKLKFMQGLPTDPSEYKHSSHFSAVGEGEPDPLRLQICYDLAYAAKPWNPDIQTIC